MPTNIPRPTSKIRVGRARTPSIIINLPSGELDPYGHAPFPLVRRRPGSSWRAFVALAAGMLALLACGGAAESECTPYEREGHFRCTNAGELQLLHCGGDWETIQVCSGPSACSPGPVPGCGR
jgi:hypothetical protein